MRRMMVDWIQKCISVDTGEHNPTMILQQKVNLGLLKISATSTLLSTSRILPMDISVASSLCVQLTFQKRFPEKT